MRLTTVLLASERPGRRTLAHLAAGSARQWAGAGTTPQPLPAHCPQPLPAVTAYPPPTARPLASTARSHCPPTARAAGSGPPSCGVVAADSGLVAAAQVVVEPPQAHAGPRRAAASIDERPGRLGPPGCGLRAPWQWPGSGRAVSG
eukprot:COSAG02_NODE_1272_length_13523_cov_3.824866_9_plen_146_part_00